MYAFLVFSDVDCIFHISAAFLHILIEFHIRVSYFARCGFTLHFLVHLGFIFRNCASYFICASNCGFIFHFRFKIWLHISFTLQIVASYFVRASNFGFIFRSRFKFGFHIYLLNVSGFAHTFWHHACFGASASYDTSYDTPHVSFTPLQCAGCGAEL